MFWSRKQQNGPYAIMQVPAGASDPLARSGDELVLQEVENEVLVYDRATAHAHCLNADAARVWRACDGKSDPDAIAVSLNLAPEVVLRALADLEAKNLLDQGPVLNGNGTTRRQFGVKVAKLGVAGAAVPMIYSVAVATPIAAATPTPAQCLFFSAQSCDGCKHICGCCCCCQGCSVATHTPACKICFPTSLCSAPNTGAGCDHFTVSGTSCSSGPNCSATAPDEILDAGTKCVQPCTNGVPSVDCGPHPCGCNGAFPNPC